MIVIKGGFGTFGCMLNSFIHFLMYFYYYLTVFGDKYKVITSFCKKYMTSMQMVISFIY